MKKIVLFIVSLMCAAAMFASVTSDVHVSIASKNSGGGLKDLYLSAGSDFSPFDEGECAEFNIALVSATTEMGICVGYTNSKDYSVLVAPSVMGLPVYVVTTAEAESEQEYTLTFEWYDPSDNTETLILHDLVADTYTEVTDGDTYDFTVTEATDAGYTAGTHSKLARFEIVRPHTVTVSYSGPAVEATTPTVGGSGTYYYGDDVEIYAQDYVAVKGLSALKKEYFVEWSDGNKDNPRTISSISEDVTLTAVYHQFVAKTILDTITVGETLTFNDAYIDDPAGRLVEAWGHAADLTTIAKASALYGNSYTTAVSAKNLGFVEYSPLPDTLYKWQLKCFSTDPVVYYVAPEGTHTTAYAAGKPATQSSWADPYGSLHLACKHAGAYHATNGQKNVVLVAAGTYKVADEPNDSTYVVSFPACIAVYGSFAGDEVLSGVGTMADQVAELVAARDVPSASAPWSFTNQTIVDGNDLRRAATTASNNIFDCSTVIDGIKFTKGRYATAKYGAGIELRGNVELRNCEVVYNNSTGAAAGGVYTAGATAADGTLLTPVIDYCKIHENTVTSATAAVAGAGVYVADKGLTVSHSYIVYNTLYGNYTTAYGAGMYIANGEVTINSSNISFNVANGTTNAIGGGLYLVKGTADVSSSMFRSNEAKGSTTKTHGAGAYIAVAGSSFDNVQFVANVLNPDAGPAYGAGLYAVNAALNDVTFGGDAAEDGNEIKGVAAAYGAGAYITGGPTLTNVAAKYNKISSGTTLYGGGLYLTGGPTLDSPVLQHNVLTPTGSASSAVVYGAGAYISGGATITDGTVSDNRITASLTTTDPDLAKLTSTAYGAGAYIAGNTLISGTTFSSNTLSATTIQSEVSTTACTSVAYGSGLYLAAATHALNGVTFSGNKLNARSQPLGGTESASAYGAGAYFNGAVAAEDVRFMTNQVQLGKTVDGVGLYAVTTSTLGEQTYLNCLFTDNDFTPLLTPTSGSATATGGGAYLNAKYSGNSINVIGCTFSYNELKAGVLSDKTGKDYGAGMTYAAHASAAVNIFESLFHHNSFNAKDATRTGVALYGAAPVLKLYNSLFYNNINGNYSVYVGADKLLHNTIAQGGGLYIYAGSASSVVANNIVWNTGSYGITGVVVDGMQVKNNATGRALPTDKDWVLADNLETLNSTNAVAGGPNFAGLNELDMSTFLHLTENSAVLVDEGLDLSVPRVAADYEGVERPQGDHYDIGAFEYYDPLTKDTLKVIAKDGYGTNLIEDGGVDAITHSVMDSVWVKGVGRVSPPKVLTVTAVPDPGYRFVEWEEDGVTTASRDVSMSANITLTAVFEEIVDEISICSSEQPYTIEITRAGDPATVLESTFSITTAATGIPAEVTSLTPATEPYVNTYTTTVKAIDGTTDSVVNVLYTVYPKYVIDKGETTINGKAYSPNGIYWSTSKSYVFADFGDYDIEETFEAMGGCDSTYQLTVHVVKAADINPEEAPLVTDWATNQVTLLMTPTTSVSAWNKLGMKINGGSSMKTIANSGITNNGDNTVTIVHASGSGKEQLLLEVYDLDDESTPVVRLYYDVPFLVTKSSTIAWNNAEQDLWVAAGTATIGSGGLVARNITVASGAILKVGAMTVVADSLTVKSYRNATGQVQISSGGKIDLKKSKFVYAKMIKDKTAYYPMSLPYAVAFNDITIQTGAKPTAKQIAIKTYDGLERAKTCQDDADAEAAGFTKDWWNETAGEYQYRTLANLTTRSWVRQTASTMPTIPANTGFEFATNASTYREFRFPLTVDRLTYQAAGRTVGVTYYEGKSASDKMSWAWYNQFGWNFIGLPSFAEKAAKKDVNVISHGSLDDYPISVYNAAEGKWDQGLSSEVKVLPFMGYFLQAEGDGDATLGVAATVPVMLAAPSAKRVQEQENSTSLVKLTLAQDTIIETLVMEEIITEDTDEEGNVTEIVEEVETTVESNPFNDRTTLWINDALSADYDMGRDLAKNFTNTDSATAPILYSFSAVGKMAISALPSEEAEKVIPLGMRFAVADNHILSLSEMPGEDVEEVLLYDALTQTTTNLMQRSYHFAVDAASVCDNRFSLQLRLRDKQDMPTDIETVGTTESGISVICNGGMISLSGLSGDTWMRVYDATGRLVATAQVGNGTSFALPYAGVYMLSFSNAGVQETVKVMYNK